MIRNIQRRWFEIWGNEEAQNQILKGLLSGTCVMVLVQTVCIVVLALRDPLLVSAFGPETTFIKVEAPKEGIVKEEVERAVRKYVSFRHNWKWQKIGDQFKGASNYVAGDFQKSFQAENQKASNLAKDKKVSQKFYIDHMNVNVEKRAVEIKGERILVVEGIRATHPMNINFAYVFGDRTQENPEGIYIASEQRIESTRNSLLGVE